jgi:hypothetical protein
MYNSISASLFLALWRPQGASIIPLKPSGYFIYHQVYQKKNVRVADTVYLRVCYGCQNKQRIFLKTVLTDWVL